MRRSSVSREGAGEPEAALTDSLHRLAAEARAETPPIDAESAWRRVEARIAGGAPAGAAPSTQHACSVAEKRSIALPGTGAQRRWRWAPALVLAVVACALGLFAWRQSTHPDSGDPGLRPVRLDVALWETDVSAGPPLGDATHELTQILEPSVGSGRRGVAARRAPGDGR